MTGIVPRSISTMKLRRSPSASCRPNTRSGTTFCSRTWPRCDSFARNANGARLVGICRREAAVFISSAGIRRRSLRAATARCNATWKLTISIWCSMNGRPASRFFRLHSDIAEFDTILVPQQARAPIGERIDVVRGSRSSGSGRAGRAAGRHSRHGRGASAGRWCGRASGRRGRRCASSGSADAAQRRARFRRHPRSSRKGGGSAARRNRGRRVGTAIAVAAICWNSITNLKCRHDKVPGILFVTQLTIGRVSIYRDFRAL